MMMHNDDTAIRSIIILGGGTSGWMTAAALAHFFIPRGVQITLVESEAIGTVGVGEATLPHLRFFNQTLGIDEQEFMRATGASYKLGIEFSNWGQQGDAYIHPFGDYGQAIKGIGFHHYWLQQKLAGDHTKIDAYSLPVMAAQQKKFLYPSNDERSILSTFSYAYHIDAGLYARYLRTYSEARGLVRQEGKVTSVVQNDNSHIDSVTLDNGLELSADLFIDCSGFRGLLIEQTLKTGYEDWSQWLPCNRAVAIPTERSPGFFPPYTKAIARDAGWQWRIPLQHRTGNGHVYCSDFISDQQALDQLLCNLDTAPTAEPNFLRFTTGKRKRAWNKNCVAIGLAGGFLEPLESTSIYLIQIAAPVAEFNRQLDVEYERVRDFLILHYHATQRTDTAFWNHCRTMKIPDDLAHKMELFRERGHVVQYKQGLFLEPSWVAVYLGQGIIPQQFDPRVAALAEYERKAFLQGTRELVTRAAADMPLHDKFLQHQLSRAPLASPAARMSLYGVRP
jgi:tryptophan halogenase